MQHRYIEIVGSRLHYRWAGEEADALPLVFLHEGLGSVELWRDFPDEVAASTGHPALIYSRRGYGRSDVAPLPWPLDYMHREALDVLPALMDALVTGPPILIGHSDGASISIIYAGAGHPVSGMVLISPHVFTEKGGLESIRAIHSDFRGSDMASRMSKYHSEPETTFRGWAEAWLAPEFESFNIESFLAGITCPVLMIQSREDEYGSIEQLDAIERQVAGRVERLILEKPGHSPHLSDTDTVVDRVADFVASISASRREA